MTDEACVVSQLRAAIPPSYFFSTDCLATILAEMTESKGVDLPNFLSPSVFRTIFNSGANPVLPCVQDDN